MESLSLVSHINGPEKLQILDAEQEQTLAQRKDQGDMEARDRLVFSCLRLVMHIASKYRNRGLPLIDLVQEGALGLLQAVDKFDWQRKTRLSTYATPWIQQAIKRALTQQVSLIRLPERIQTELWNLASSSAQLTQTLGREPTENEVSSLTGLSLSRIDQLRLWNLLNRKESSQDLVSENLDEVATPQEDLDMDERLDRQNRYELIQQCFLHLDEEEQKVLSARYGLNDGEVQTLSQIGTVMGCSYEKIRLIENRGLNKLRQMICQERED